MIQDSEIWHTRRRIDGVQRVIQRTVSLLDAEAPYQRYVAAEMTCEK